MKRIDFLAGILLATGLLHGCVVVPVPVERPSGQVEGSRPAIPASIADQVIPSRTTRTEVLLMLGEPDGRGVGDRWFSYGSRIGRGGFGWILVLLSGVGYGGGAPLAMPVGKWETSHRAIIRFGTDGTVSSVEFSEKACSEDCLDIGGTKIKAADELARKHDLHEQQVMTAGSQLARYGGYVVESGPQCSFPTASFLVATSINMIHEPDAMEIAERGVFWTHSQSAAPDHDEPAFIAFADLADVTLEASHGGMTWLALHKRDGTCLFVHAGHVFTSGADMRKARALILDGVSATAALGHDNSSQKPASSVSDPAR